MEQHLSDRSSDNHRERLRCETTSAYLDRSIRAEIVAIRNMTLGVPMADAAFYLVEKVEAALISQVSEVANEVGDRMLVACAAMLLKNRHCFRGPGNVALSIIGNPYQPLVPPEILEPIRRQQPTSNCRGTC